MPTVAAISAFLDRFAPPGLAANWDNVGLLLGDAASEVERLLTCLTITEAVVDEAVAADVQLIIAHHPILFRGAKRLNTSSAEGRAIWRLARAGVAVYSPHTAFDNCVGGINDFIAGCLGLIDIAPLRPIAEPKTKIVVFTPDADLSRVADALFEAGAGQVGQYTECSYRLAGTGTFFGSSSSNPTIGQKGRREEVAEWRLEVVCPEAAVSRVVSAMRKAHSYEEPAFDVYPLRGVPGSTGEGRIGRLSTPQSLADLARCVKEKLNAGGIQLVGDPSRPVERIAIACGAAGEFLNDAIRAKADAFLTGEMRFHDYLNAQSQGIALILPGHYATERPAVEQLARNLQSEFPTLKAWASERESDPVTWQ